MSTPIYVDPMMTCIPNRRWRWNAACHLFVDTPGPLDDLHEFAKKIGLRREWFQDGKLPHYDLNESKRALAIQMGAMPLDRRDAVMVFRRWRSVTGNDTAPPARHGRSEA